MKDKIKNDVRRIGYSFGRAFVAVIAVTEIGDVQDARGWQGVFTAAVVAGIAAALRTMESIFGTVPADPTEN